MDVQGWVVIALAVVLFGYLVPHLVHSRQQLAEARVEDRFSTTLRVVGTGATARRSSPGEHHGTRENRPYLHDPRRRTEAPAVNRPTTPSERAAAEARRLATARAARAAEISRRKAAARRRLVLTLLLLTASVAGWAGFGVASMSLAAGIVPTVLLAVVLLLGRRAARIAARRNAADRAAMARLAPRPEPRTHTGAPRTGSTASAAKAGDAPVTDTPTSAQERPGAGSAAGEPTTADASGTAPTASRTEERGSSSSSTEQQDDEAPARSGPGDAPSADVGENQAWTPVPVPAPSYTLKAAAPRRDIAPYEAPEPEPVPVEVAAQPVVASGLAGSPYAAVVDPEPEEASAPAVGPARGLDLDSVLARRRAASA